MSRFIVVIGLLLASGLAASADVVAGPTVDGFTTFIDTNTGFDWLTLDNFFGEDYATQLASLPSGYVVASFAEVDALAQNSMPDPTDPTSFDYYNSIVMGSTSRALLWGNYADTTVGGSPNGWYYAFDGESWAYDNSGYTIGFSDLGLWALKAAVPEPRTASLWTGAGALLWVALLCVLRRYNPVQITLK